MTGYFMEQIAELYRPKDLMEVESALQFISPDICRDEWVRVGMGLKADYGEGVLR
jgi:hypothetical protein